MSASLRFLCLASLLALGAGFAACGAPTTNEGLDLTGTGAGDGGSGVCTPGATKECACLGGGMGTKVCRASGQSYGTCSGCTDEPMMGTGGTGDCGDCDGCCEGTSCVPFADQDDSQCGTRGNNCASCGSKVCDTDDGQCVTASAGCNSSNCANGCCKMVNGQMTCQENKPSACGSGGVTCTMVCPAGSLCTGSCTGAIDPDYNFKIIVTGSTFYNTDSDDDCWDDFFKPCTTVDPRVCMAFKTGASLSAEACNDELSNTSASSATVMATWNDTTGLLRASGQPLLVPGQALLDGNRLLVTVYDEDVADATNDVIGSFYAPAFTNVSTDKLGPFQRVQIVNIKLQ